MAYGGRTQVNKALHTCMSWYAYAAMFSSSWMIQAKSFIVICTGIAFVPTYLPLLDQLKPLACIVQYWRRALMDTWQVYRREGGGGGNPPTQKF